MITTKNTTNNKIINTTNNNNNGTINNITNNFVINKIGEESISKLKFKDIKNILENRKIVYITQSNMLILMIRFQKTMRCVLKNL